MTLRLLRRYWHTGRHLRPNQVLARVNLRGRALLRRLRPGAARRRYARRARQYRLDVAIDPWRLRGAGALARAWMSAAALARVESHARDTLEGTLCFHGERASLGRPIDWTARNQTQLWRYHLHYFDALPDMLVADAPWPQVVALLEEWDDRNPLGAPGSADAWHPYVVSVRIVNWMLALASAPRDGVWPEAVLASLRAQTIFVARNLETDVGGNHLLKNLKALSMAGCFWRGTGSDAIRDEFVARFTAALSAQLRSDGGHYEQSPMYHCQTFADAIEVAVALRLSGRDVPRELVSAIARMDAFLARICHPDGDIPRFGDSASGMTPEVSELRDAAAMALGRQAAPGLVARHALAATVLLPGAEATHSRPSDTGEPGRMQPSAHSHADEAGLPGWDPEASGFLTLETADRRCFLIADAGPVCPDDLPAHGHSDTFGFEASVDGTRLIVDSGVSEYRPGIWREYERSTRAHNTVVVDGTEQSDCWASFRVAARARVIGGRTTNRSGLRGFAATHTGYDRGWAPVRHTRHFFVVDERFWIIVDELTGRGSHTWTTHLHVHPEASVARQRDVILVSRAARSGVTRPHVAGPPPDAALAVAWFGVDAPLIVKGALDPPQGWYAPAFGVRLAAPALSCEGRGELPARFGWLLVPHPPHGEALTIAADGPARVRVGIGSHVHEVSLAEMQSRLAGATRSSV